MAKKLKGLGFGKRRLIAEIISKEWDITDPYEKKLGLNDVLYIIQEMDNDEGKAYLEGSTNLNKGFSIFKKFANLLLTRNIANYDSMVLMTSEKGCLTDDTLLMVPRESDMRPEHIPLKQLIDKGPINVYSFNKVTEKVEIKSCDGVEFAKYDEIYELTFDKGHTIKCTGNHPFMIKDGSYIEARNLHYSHEVRYETETYTKTERIHDIKYIGKQNVYDVVNVKDNHNFIANGFVVSNTGKSSAAIMLARAWCQLIGIRFDPKRHLAYNNKDVMNKIDMLNKFEPLVCDEAVRFASSADWNKADSKELRKKLAEVRTKHLLFILCFPLKIYKMEKNYLESFVNYWCLTGDTQITVRNKNGNIKYIPIKNVNDEVEEVLSYNVNKNIYEFKKYKETILVKKNAEVFKLTLNNNLNIKCTDDHPFLTQRGWVRLKELKLSDYVEVKTKKYKYSNDGFSSEEQIKIKNITKLKKHEDVYDIIGVEDNNNFVANNMVVHNCDLFGRGIGAIYVKDRNPVNDSWRMKDFKNVGSYTEFTRLSEVEKKLKKHPNFWQIIKFPKPPEWLYTKYLAVREKNVYDNDMVREMVTTTDIHKSLLLLALQDIMMNDTTINMNRIALHIKNKYDILISKKNIMSLLSDAKQLVTTIREEKVTSNEK